MADRTVIFPYKRLKKAFAGETFIPKLDMLMKIKQKIFSYQLKQSIVFSVMGFLLGRAVILDFLNPFGMAFLSVAILQEINTPLVAVGILLGVVSVAQKELILKYFVSMLLLMIMQAVLSKTRINKKALFTFMACVSNFVAGYSIYYIKNYYMYDLLMVIIETALIGILIYIYDNGFPIIKNFKRRKVLSKDEIVAFAILAAFCFVGADFSIYGLSVKNICVIFTIMMFSYIGGANTGTAVGLILGLIQALSGSILPSAIGVYGLCGLLSGILVNMGKAGCPLGFILANMLMTFYINGSTEVLIKFYEILTASLIFMLLPKKTAKALLSFKALSNKEGTKDSSFDKRIKDYTMDKLSEVSEVFKELSLTLKDSICNREYFSQADAAQLIDQVANKCCTNCGMCKNCWKRDFYKTYQHMFGLLSIIENEGELDIKKVAAGFKERCLKSEEIVISLKHYYDLYRNSLNWTKKVNESRLVVCEQLKEVSSVVSNLALQINTEVKFNTDIEEMIMVALDNQEIYAEDVIVAQSGGIYEVDIKLAACGGKRDCIKNIIPIVNKATGRKFAKKDMICNVRSNNMCNIKLREAQRYQIATGVSRAYKSGTVSGDNYSFIELKDGKFMLALSDGMGTGPKAALESNTTIRLLEKLLYAGFDKDVAVKTINSLLLMKSNEESYATVDMSVINQYNGEVEFVKVGAVSTFIKYQDRVDVIKVGSLPIGILNNIEMEFIRRKLKDGDFLIMVTDGILDSNKEVIDKEEWLAHMIEDINTRNPQKMADSILDKCLELSGGQALDDMTVMVAKIWETV